MDNKPEQKKPEAMPSRRDWGQQMIGGVIGALVMAVILQIGSTWGWEVANRTSFVLGGAAVGAVFSSLDHFAQAGSRLTGRKTGKYVRALNIMVGLAGLFVIAGFVWVLVTLIGWIGQLF